MNKTLRTWVTLGFTAFGLAAVGGGVGLTWYLREHSNSFFTDADTIDRSVDQASPRDILWREPTDLSPVINTATDEYAAGLGAEGVALYFARRTEGSGTDENSRVDLYVCHKTPTGWSEPIALDAINSRGDDLDPVISGGSLYFSSNRPGGHGDYDLWVAHRRAGSNGVESWETPVNLGPAVNSRGNEYGPALTADGAILYFASDRSAGVDRRDFDLYVLDLTVPDASPVAVDRINTVHDETSPAVSPAGDFVYFASDRPGGAGGFDLYRSRRLYGAHMPALSLGAPVNTAADELDPAVSLGGFGLHFAAGRNGSFDLRYTVSREVFTRTETYRADLAWGTLWTDLWPYLLWLLGAIALLAILAGLLHRLEYRKLTLLARCLMVSLLIHMLLMVGFAFWGVSSVLSEWTRPGRGTRVMLTAPSVGSGLAHQVRATLAPPDVTADWPEAAAERRPLDAQTIPVDLTQVRAEALPVAAGRIETTQSPAMTVLAHDAPAMTSVARPQVSAPAIAEAPPVTLDVPVESNPSRSSEAAVANPAASVERPRAARRVTQVTSSEHDAPTVTAAAPVARSRLDVTATRLVSTMGHDAPAVSAAPARPTALPDLGRVEPVPVDGPSEESHVRHAEAGPSVEAGAIAATRTARVEPATAAGGDELLLRALTMTPAPSAVAPLSEPIHMKAMTGLPAAWSPSVPAPSAVPDTGGSIELALPAMQEQPAVQAQRRAERGDDVQAIARLAGAAREPGGPGTPAMALPVMDAGEVDASARISPSGALSAFVPSRVVHATAHDAPAPATSTRTITDVVPTVTRPSVMASDLPRLEESSVVSEPERAQGPVAVPGSSPRRRWAPPAEAEPRRAGDVRAPRHTAEARMKRVDHAVPVAAVATDIRSDRLDVRHPVPPVLASLDLDLKIPTRTAPLPAPYRHREPLVRTEILQEMGGGAETERAVALALDWLARHQGPDGRWDGERFDDRCGQCDGTQRVKCDAALTGLSLLCFLATDNTHLKDGPYRRTVDRAVSWLLDHQESNGDLMDGESMYSHGIATIALAEAYGMTHDPRLAEPVEAAVRFIYEAREKSVGGWRYRPGQAGDTSVMGWQVMALTSARRAGIDVPEDAFDIARRWLDLVHRPSQPGTYAYQPRREVTPAMTAEGMFVRQLLGAGRDEPRMRGSARYILDHPPSWRPNANTYYWYYATLALFQHQGPQWRQWNESIKLLLVGRQLTSGRLAGSWDPDGRWAGVAGRVYQTAIATLTLEVYYRYLPLFVRQR